MDDTGSIGTKEPSPFYKQTCLNDRCPDHCHRNCIFWPMSTLLYPWLYPHPQPLHTSGHVADRVVLLNTISSFLYIRYC